MIPHMQMLQDQYRERGLVVLGVNSWEEKDPSAMMAKKGASYTLLLNGESIANNYGVKLLPVIYIIGRDGKIFYRHEGAEKRLREVIEESLGLSRPPSASAAIAGFRAFSYAGQLHSRLQPL
jgi:peroxiredoxin